ncbi:MULTISPECIES: sensor histidine kinase [Methylobacteriaceae]
MGGAIIDGRGLNTDFDALFAFVADPLILVRPCGLVEAANPAALAKVRGLAIAAALPIEATRREQVARFLDLCFRTESPVPGALFVRCGDDDYARHPCRGARIVLEVHERQPLVLLHLIPTGLDARIRILADRLNDARRVMQERKRRGIEMQALLAERDRLLAHHEEDAQARRRAEAERDAVLSKLYRAGQDERRRLARDLHDHAGQQLVMLTFGLRRIASRLSCPVSLREVEQLLHHTQDIGQSLRRVTLELRPAALDEFGFVTALRSLVEEWSRITEMETEFQIVGEEVDLSLETAITLYRLTQEALTNVAKHAGSDVSVSVVLRYSAYQVTLTIDDDGSGFEVDQAVASALVSQDKLGLLGMRERLSLVDGTLSIESAPGHGTSIVARVYRSTEGSGHV